ncbi:MAG: DUF3108 domain-containing protein [Pseudomonadota bacterium]|nr:DUF3108 domain-containing protein [Pseudomonadota bacterium]
MIGIVAAMQMIFGVAFATNRNIDLLYDISWGALHLAEATSQWQMQDNKAVILGSVKSDGIASLVSGFQSASSAEIKLHASEWHPIYLSLSRITKSKQIASSVHWSASGDILSDVQQPPPDLDKVFPILDKLKQNVIDPYSAVMRQLEYIGTYGKCAGSYAIYDGLRRFEMQFDTVGDIDLVADRPYGFDGQALHCQITVFPKGGHRIESSWHKKPDKDRQFSVYFGRFSLDLVLPVRVEIEAPIGVGVARLNMIKSNIPGMTAAH